MGGISNLIESMKNIGSKGMGKTPPKLIGDKGNKPKYAPNIPLPPVHLVLGDYTFTRFEIPEKINQGGDQKLVIHELVGGDRVIDEMGGQYDPLTWSGMFLGEDALDHAKYINHLRKQGKPLTLKWSEMEYSVIIHRFAYDFMQSYRIPYSITCEVITDLSTQVTYVVIDVDQALKDDMGTVATASTSLLSDPTTNIAKVKSNVDKLKDAFNKTRSFVRSTQKTIKETKALIVDAQKEVTQAIATVNNTLQGITTLGGVLPNNSVSKNVAKLGNTAKNTNNAIQLMNLKHTLGNMNKTISTIKVNK